MPEKLGLDPDQLDDQELEREYERRFPERTEADALRTREGSRTAAGQPPDGR